jgi:hypothetical protein
MEGLNEKLIRHWKDVGNVMLGAWLSISPWVLSYAGELRPAWNAHVVGVIIAVAALAGMIAFTSGKSGSTSRSQRG